MSQVQAQYHIQWLDKEKSILLMTYSGRMLAHEYFEAYEEISREVAQVSHTVYMIVDLSSVTYVDAPGFVKFAPKFNLTAAPNLHLTVTVGLNPAARAVVNTVARLVPRLVSTIRQAKSLEEAHEIIENYRAQELSTEREITQKLG